VFCPDCKAEYRFGFTKCSDCGVDLVAHLPDGSSALMELVGDPDAMKVLWAGVDAQMSGSVRKALDTAKIAYKEDTVESQLMPAFRQCIYRIEVRRGDYKAAVESIQDLVGGDAIKPKSPSALLDRNSSFLNVLGISRGLFHRGPVGEPSPTQTGADEIESHAIAENDFESSDSSGHVAQDDLAEDFFPEDATSEVWSGEDQEMAENIRMCLREVGIGSEVKEQNGKSRVLVMPQAEARAREIIREIIEATPPE
jgi:hypothetical protein